MYDEDLMMAHYSESAKEAELAAALYQAAAKQIDEGANHESAITITIMFVLFVLAAFAGCMSLFQSIADHENRLQELERKCDAVRIYSHNRNPRQGERQVSLLP